MKGQSDVMPVDAAIAVIHATPPEARSRFAKRALAEEKGTRDGWEDGRGAVLTARWHTDLQQGHSQKGVGKQAASTFLNGIDDLCYHSQHVAEHVKSLFVCNELDFAKRHTEHEYRNRNPGPVHPWGLSRI